jgi:hypothetical protein
MAKSLSRVFDLKNNEVVHRPVVFIHYPHSNPHPSQMGRVWVENNYSLKKWVGWVWGGYK